MSFLVLFQACFVDYVWNMEQLHLLAEHGEISCVPLFKGLVLLDMQAQQHTCKHSEGRI